MNRLLMLRLLLVVPLLAGIGWLVFARNAPDSGSGRLLSTSASGAAASPSMAVRSASARPFVLTPLVPTPRARFTPTTRKGYWNIDIVGDFTLPPTRSITFCGAGRNLHVKQDWSKLFRRGFSSIDRLRMVQDEVQDAPGSRPATWRSRLAFSQRAQIIYQNYFTQSAVNLPWARDANNAPDTYFSRPPANPLRNTMQWAMIGLSGGCVAFNDCPQGYNKATYSKIYLDIENDGVNPLYRQEQANLYVYMMTVLKENVAPGTEIGSITPVAHNSFGYSRADTYTTGADWLWTMPARHTATSLQRGMPDAIVGKSFGELVDFNMPGTYYLYPEFDYSASHNDDGGRHWLAALLGEQEVNIRLSPKKRIAWQWLFNTQNADFAGSLKADHPAPPAIAEGMSIFYWFTGAYGVLFWDDWGDLIPDQPTPTDPGMQGLGNDRNYACYEYYIHGLWRLFKHHGDLFNGREIFLNDQTDCSYDGGKTWLRLNANQLKTKDLPFVRAMINGNQILVAATKPYAKPETISRVMLRYIDNGRRFYTDITLHGDEIFLGRASMQ
jgi:hypothetical protein